MRAAASVDPQPSTRSANLRSAHGAVVAVEGRIHLASSRVGRRVAEVVEVVQQAVVAAVDLQLEVGLRDVGHEVERVLGADAGDPVARPQQHLEPAAAQVHVELGQDAPDLLHDVHGPVQLERQDRRDHPCAADQRLRRARARLRPGRRCRARPARSGTARSGAGCWAAGRAPWRSRPRRSSASRSRSAAGARSGRRSSCRARPRSCRASGRTAACRSPWPGARMLDVEVFPPRDVNVPVSVRGSQPVGFRKKPSRSTVISILRIGSGTPSSRCGMPSLICGPAVGALQLHVDAGVRLAQQQAVDDHHVGAEVDRVLAVGVGHAGLGGHGGHDRGDVARLARARRGRACPAP